MLPKGNNRVAMTVAPPGNLLSPLVSAGRRIWTQGLALGLGLHYKTCGICSSVFSVLVPVCRSPTSSGLILISCVLPALLPPSDLPTLQHFLSYFCSYISYKKALLCLSDCTIYLFLQSFLISRRQHSIIFLYIFIVFC